MQGYKMNKELAMAHEKLDDALIRLTAMMDHDVSVAQAIDLIGEAKDLIEQEHNRQKNVDRKELIERRYGSLIDPANIADPEPDADDSIEHAFEEIDPVSHDPPYPDDFPY